MRKIAGAFIALSIAVPACAEDGADTREAVPAMPADIGALKAEAEAIDPLANASQSEAAWRRYLAALEASGRPAAERAVALNRIGDSLYYQQDAKGALGTALAAKALLEEADDTKGEAMAEALANAAVFYGVNGMPEKVLPLQERSLAIRTGLYGEDPGGLEPAAAKALGLGYLNYATALYERGRFGEAADYIEPSIAGLIAGGLTDATLFVAMSSGANILTDAGRQREALAMAQRGVEKAIELLPEGHPFMGFAQASLGRTLLEAGRYEEAEEPTRRALDIMTEKLGPDHRNTLTAMHNLGVLSAYLGRYEEALALTERRYEALRDKDGGEAVVSLAAASNAAFELGDEAKARELAERAAELAAQQPADDAKATRGFETLSLRLEEAGEYGRAGEALDVAIERVRLEAVATALPVLTIRRGLLALRQDPNGAGWPMVLEGLEALESNLIRDAAQTDLDGDLVDYYEPLMQAAEAAIVAGEADTALRAFELASWGVNARARQFVALRRQQAGDDALAAEVETYAGLRDTLRRLRRERAALLARDDTAGAGERAAAIAANEERLAESTATLTAAIPDFERWLRPETPDLEALQSALGNDEALLIAMPARARTLVMAVTADGVALHEAGLSRREVRANVERLRGALDFPGPAEDFPLEAAAALHEAILPPAILALLGGKNEVALVTSDALSRLPLGVLVPDSEIRDFREMDWLVRRHAFSVALSPSAVLGQTEAKGRGGNPGRTFVGIGAPALDGQSSAGMDNTMLFRGGTVSIDDIRSLPALPATEGEIRRVAQALGQGGRAMVLTGADATEQRVRQLGDASGTEEPRSVNVLLFATHGLLEGEIGGLQEPALVLTPPEQSGGPDNDGLLVASEIAALGYAAEFVVLSACNSAAGRNRFSPAYTGLANAFLGSGSDALMLSHWRVRDDAASRLTVETVRQMADGSSKAAALQKAQLALIEDLSVSGAAHPATWAPFVIIGD